MQREIRANRMLRLRLAWLDDGYHGAHGLWTHGALCSSLYTSVANMPLQSRFLAQARVQVADEAVAIMLTRAWVNKTKLKVTYPDHLEKAIARVLAALY
jgi:hypothetical protein